MPLGSISAFDTQRRAYLFFLFFASCKLYQFPIHTALPQGRAIVWRHKVAIGLGLRFSSVRHHHDVHLHEVLSPARSRSCTGSTRVRGPPVSPAPAQLPHSAPGPGLQPAGCLRVRDIRPAPGPGSSVPKKDVPCARCIWCSGSQETAA